MYNDSEFDFEYIIHNITTASLERLVEHNRNFITPLIIFNGSEPRISFHIFINRVISTMEDISRGYKYNKRQINLESIVRQPEFKMRMDQFLFELVELSKYLMTPH